MVWRALVVIPIGTVLVEELLFRGVLLGLLQRIASAGRALLHRRRRLRPLAPAAGVARRWGG